MITRSKAVEFVIAVEAIAEAVVSRSSGRGAMRGSPNRNARAAFKPCRDTQKKFGSRVNIPACTLDNDFSDQVKT